MPRVASTEIVPQSGNFQNGLYHRSCPRVPGAASGATAEGPQGPAQQEPAEGRRGGDGRARQGRAPAREAGEARRPAGRGAQVPAAAADAGGQQARHAPRRLRDLLQVSEYRLQGCPGKSLLAHFHLHGCGQY